MHSELMTMLAVHPVVWIPEANPMLYDGNDHDDAIVISHSVTDRSFRQYVTAEAILQSFIAKYEKKDPEMAKEVEKSFVKLMNSWRKMDMSSESIIFSIIRRISRETSATTKLIDQLAQKMASLIRKVYAQEGKPLVLILHHAEWIDRPSIRVLNRLYKLLPRTHLKMAWLFSQNIPSEVQLRDPFDLMESIRVARGRLFTRLKTEMEPAILDHQGEPPAFAEFAFEPSGNGLASDAAIALVTQNYENAYLATRECLERDMATEETYRILGLVHANLGLYEPAYHVFHQAAEIADTNPKRAHIECLTALLAVKRFYNLDVARAHYEKAMGLVDESDPQNRLEKGWVLNGMSFMDTVAASRVTGQEKEQILERVLKRELEALQLIKNDPGNGALYLRYNLYGNISFLFEIRKDYAQAWKTWTKVFGRVIGNDHGYCYRAGMLAWKAGFVDDAFAYLQKAKEVAFEEQDRLDLESICYALGYISLKEGRYHQAADQFMEGFGLALALCKWDQVKKQAVGCLQSSQDSGLFERHLFSMREMVRDYPMPDELAEFLNQNHSSIKMQLTQIELPQPKSKLSSYHPSVDLEVVPEIDMNAYLIDENTDKAFDDLVQHVAAK